MSSQEACALLGIDSMCSREELRAAYLARIKEVSSSSGGRCCQWGARLINAFSPAHVRLSHMHSVTHVLRAFAQSYAAESASWLDPVQVHPDVNPALRSTDDAVLLNEAYAVLQLVSPSSNAGTG